ncbi:MAG: histidinol-phosphate transaminase [Deltaproteobacteria bacterium]|nr:MAG: histidinol-phosphate transaminase [Deltaproteobacteria bacterium]
MEALKNHPLLEGKVQVSSRIRELAPYDPVSSLDAIKSRPGMVHYKLDWNETTVPPSPRVKKRLVEYLQNGYKLHWYPEMNNRQLFEKIAGYVGCRPSQVLVTNGSDEALELLCQCYLEDGYNVVSPVPTYNHFLHFARRTGATVKEVRGANPFLPSLKEIARAIDGNTKIVYLANPNNPTGNLYSPAEVLQLAIHHPQVLIVSDEAYYEFAGVSCAKLVEEVDNIVVTRSFSKCFVLAGLRIGYLVGSDSIITDMRRVHNPKSVNTMAQLAAVAALEDLPYYKSYIRSVKRGAALVQDFCRKRGIRCIPTYANFVLIQLDEPTRVAEMLAEQGVYVRDRSHQLPGIIRLGLGTEEQMAEVLQRFEQVLLKLRN